MQVVGLPINRMEPENCLHLHVPEASDVSRLWKERGPYGNSFMSTCEIQDASMADCASPSRAVIAHIAPTSRPTACSVADARVPVHNDYPARPQGCRALPYLSRQHLSHHVVLNLA